MRVWCQAGHLSTCLLILVVTISVSTGSTSVVLKGYRTACYNEGEPFLLKDDWSSCYHCICKNGFVECQEECGPIDQCAVIMPRAGCCARCKGCWYNGTEYTSHTEWSDSEGRLLRCEAGVMTISKPECYAPCSRPSSQRLSYYNCPVCDQCVINGQRVWEGRDVRIPDEPCLSCRCVAGTLSCAKKACPVIPCPKNHYHTVPGECCPRCLHPTADKLLPGHVKKPCIIGKEFHAHLSPFRVDPCTDCTCMNGTAVCTRHTCPVLTCGSRALPPQPGKCCPECPHTEEANTACVIGGKTYQDGESWQLDACKSCECHGGAPRCAMERCPSLICSLDQTLRKLPGQCCPKCVDKDGICTVFGDPHYKTFDGKFFSFQGSCKYQLVSDCVNNTFSIRISNDARNTTHSSWTRTATLRIGTEKINMGKKMRVKVNGKRVTPPHVVPGVGDISRVDGGLVLVKADVGVQMLWDGDGFLEVTVSSSFKGNVCGLCGNFNSLARDDLTTPEGRLVGDPWKFGTSWRVGGRHACTRRTDRPMKSRCGRSKKRIARRLCREFDQNEVFSACGLKVNPVNYREACERDACGCTGAKCHCAAYRAYARECQRVNAEPVHWEQAVWCEGTPPPGIERFGKEIRANKPKDTDILNPGVIPKPNKDRSRPPPILF